MPEIPPILYRWILSSGPASDDERFAINNFIVEAINEYDDDQLPVDVDWWWEITQQKSLTYFLADGFQLYLGGSEGNRYVQLEYVDSRDCHSEYGKQLKTRGDVRNLLEVLEK